MTERGKSFVDASCQKHMVSHLRHASQVLRIRSQNLQPGIYWPFYIIQNSTITQAHSDKPHIYPEIQEIHVHPDSMN